MKIIHVNKFFDLHGGAESYLHELMARQRAAGHEVHAFSTRSERNRPSEDAKYFVTRHAYDRKEGPIMDLRKAVDFIWNKEAERSFDEMLAEVKPDVVHLHNIYHHLSVSVLKPIKDSHLRCVQTLHDYKLACPNYKMFVAGKPCEKCKGGHYCQAIRNDCLNGFFPSALAAAEMSLTKMNQAYESAVGSFICPSSFLLEKMTEWGEPRSKMVHVPNPVQVPPLLTEDRGTGAFVYIGRLSKEKGIETVIKAFARMPDKELLIFGQGPEGPTLQAEVRRLDIQNVRFMGYAGADELGNHRRKAKALLMPTLMYENSSLAILEALADGVPVIGSSIGGIPELVKDGVNGFLAEAGHVDSWIEAINQMDGYSLEQRLEMGETGRFQVQKYHNWENHLKKIEEVYKNG